MSDGRERTALDVFIVAAHHEAIVGSLVGGMAHYVNNLLGGVLGLVTLAPSLTSDDLAGLCRRLHTQVEEAGGLTRTLLSLKRRTTPAGGAEMTDVTGRADELVRLANACGGSSSAVELDLPEGSVWGAIRPGHFSECLLPLLVSAAQAAGEKQSGMARVQVRLRSEGDSCVISIDDNGPPAQPDDGRQLLELVEAGEAPTSRSVAFVAASGLLAMAGGSLTRHEQGCVLRLPLVATGQS